MSSGKLLRVGGQDFDLRFDFFLCPKHGLFVPKRIDDDWNTDEGCPIFLNDWGERCDEPLTAVFLDGLTSAGGKDQ